MTEKIKCAILNDRGTIVVTDLWKTPSEIRRLRSLGHHIILMSKLSINTTQTGEKQ